MEKMEYHSGKLKIIPKESGENLEDQCKRLVNGPLHVYYKNYVEMITDQFREKYIIHNADDEDLQIAINNYQERGIRIIIPPGIGYSAMAKISRVIQDSVNMHDIGSTVFDR